MGGGTESRLGSIDASARALAGGWTDATNDIAAYEAKLDDLAALVADVQGSTAALPARIKLPSVSMHGAIGSLNVSVAASLLLYEADRQRRRAQA